MANLYDVAMALKALEDNEGRVKPEAVVAAAKDPGSVLHAYFEWNDKKAAASFRIEQARDLIRRVRIDVSVDERVVNVPAYVRDPSRPESETGYRAIARLRSDEDEARSVVVTEMGRAAAALSRARAVSEVLGVREQVETIEKMVKDVSTTLREQAQTA